MFAVVIKYLEMKRSFWIICVGPNFNDNCVCKRDKRDLIQIEEEEAK